MSLSPLWTGAAESRTASSPDPRPCSVAVPDTRASAEQLVETNELCMDDSETPPPPSRPVLAMDPRHWRNPQLRLDRRLQPTPTRPCARASPLAEGFPRPPAATHPSTLTGGQPNLSSVRPPNYARPLASAEAAATHATQSHLSTDEASRSRRGFQPARSRHMSTKPRILVLSSSHQKLSSLSPFHRKDGCDRFGRVLRCDKLRDGAIEVEFASEMDAARALKATTFTFCRRDRSGRRDVSLSMTVTPHRSKNFVKGVIRCFDLRGTSGDEIAEGLAPFSRH